MLFLLLYRPLNEVEGVYTGFTLPVCPSVRLWTESRPLCIFHNTIYTSNQQNSAKTPFKHNECDGVLNHQPQDGLLNRLFGCRSQKTSKLRVTGLCAGNSPVTGELPAQKASNAEMFPFDDVIISRQRWMIISHSLVWVKGFLCLKLKYFTKCESPPRKIQARIIIKLYTFSRRRKEMSICHSTAAFVKWPVLLYGDDISLSWD